MKSRISFRYITLPVLTFCLLVLFSACGGGRVAKSDQTAKDFGMVKERETRPQPQSAKDATQPERAGDGRFIAYDNGTVLDTRTGLMWAAQDSGSGMNWASAKSYCENYRGGGYADWRMPTRDELAGLYGSSKSFKATQRDSNFKVTELIHLSACCPWACERRGSDAAYVHFMHGTRYCLFQPADCILGAALPVRSGQ